jgi:hypothetical protein
VFLTVSQSQDSANVAKTPRLRDLRRIGSSQRL